MCRKITITARLSRFIMLVLLAVFWLGVPLQASAVVNTHSYIDGYGGTQVDTWNGNLNYSRTDLKIPARSLPIDITMSYNLTGRGEDRGFGYGWQVSYDMRYELSGSDVTIRYGQGGESRFRWNGSSYTPPTGSQDTLSVYGAGYLLTTKYGTKYYFDSASHQKITRMEDSQGNTLTFTYTGTQLTGITDTHGRSVTLAYTGGRLTSITDSNTTPARTIQYQYNVNGDLTKVINPVGGENTYVYSGTLHLMKSITDLNGNIFSIGYKYESPDKYFAKTISNGTDTISIDYSSLTNKRTINYNVGGSLYKSTVHKYDNTGRLIQKDSKNQTWDLYNNVDSRTDENGNTIIYSYDAKGNLLKEYSPLVNGVSYSTRYTYEPTFNKVATHTDARGNTTSYEYDAQGRQTRVIDALGNSALYSYDTNNNLLRETNPKGIITRYQYNVYGNRTWETKNSGELNLVTSYAYDNVGNMTGQTDPRGKTTAYKYDLLNRKTKTTDALSNDTLYSYDGNGNLVRQTDAEGRITRYRYNSRNLQTKVMDALLYSTTNEYDFVGNLVKKTDARGNSTTYQYSYVICAACGRDRLVGVADAYGNSILYSHDKVGNILRQTDTRGKITRYAYDALNRRFRQTDALGNSTLFSYDGVGNRIRVTNGRGYAATYTYDALNRRIAETDALSYTTLSSYDPVGNILKATDAESKITRYQYDNANRKIKETKEKTGADAETFYYYDENGNITTATDPNGYSTTYAYDDLNRRIRMTNALGENEIYSYDAVGNRLRVTAANGNVTRYVYDSLNRLTGVSDTLGTVAGYAYDAVGNRITETNADGNTTGYVYDNLNRLTQTTDALGNSSLYSYDKAGNRLRVTDREGKITRYVYNALNRLVTETKDPGGLNIATAYEYDAVGNRTRITDDKGNPTDYTYDEVNRLTQETYADSTMVDYYSYDRVGNRLTRQDQNGDITYYTYDDLHRLTLRDYPDSNDDSFTYDLGGRMLTADNGISSVRYTYDDINRVTEERQNGQVIGYAYDTANRTRQITYPGGRVIVETRDLRNRLDTVTEGANTIAGYSYTGGQLTELAYLNGTTATYSYNANNWITTLSHYNGGSRIAEFGYGFDREGNRKYAERLHDPGNSEQYIYDNIYRLTDFRRGTLDGNKEIPVPVTQTAYTLDGVGNWDSKTTDGVTETRTHNTVNEITAIDGTGLNYDYNGNLTDDSAKTYAYDYENRLTQVTRKSDSQVLAEFKYDARGRRIEKNDVLAGVITRYYLDGGRVIEEQESGATTATYVYGDWIDAVLSMTRGGNTYYYHPNSLGSIDTLTDSLGDVVEYYRYDAYGTASVYDGNWVYQGTASTVGNPYMFTGRQWDNEIGLYYYRARYYSPTLGRFLQHDPLGYVDGMNLYEYVKGNPGNGVDPYGTRFICSWDIHYSKSWMERLLLDLLYPPNWFYIFLRYDAKVIGDCDAGKIYPDDEPGFRFSATSVLGISANGVGVALGQEWKADSRDLSGEPKKCCVNGRKGKKRKLRLQFEIKSRDFTVLRLWWITKFSAEYTCQCPCQAD